MINSSKFKKAIKLAKEYYKDKTDGSGNLIFDHCFRVSTKLYELLKNANLKPEEKENIVIVGLFHDLIEDTPVRKKEILFFGKKFFDYTSQMTINFDKGIKNAVKLLYKIDEKVFLIKLADIFDNVIKSFFVIRKNSFQWYYKFFIPLLHEYQILIKHKRKNLKNNKLRKTIQNFSEQVFEKIEELKKVVKLNKELMICD